MTCSSKTVKLKQIKKQTNKPSSGKLEIGECISKKKNQSESHSRVYDGFTRGTEQ